MELSGKRECHGLVELFRLFLGDVRERTTETVEIPAIALCVKYIKQHDPGLSQLYSVHGLF